ncbi:MAG: DUF1846 domain-containing protein [Lachnospiraceae bacterium]|nr:DUF1846 domain-containing protein [Lachnospiraceae bacterium]
MKRIGFDNEKYLRIQSTHIKERIDKYEKLYLEFGGKLLDDYHASRVLPGFMPDSKLKMLENLKDEAEIVFVISADAIEQNKTREDLGITYDVDVLRLIDAFRQKGFYVSSVVITKYTGQAAAEKFRLKLETHNINTYLHYVIDGYPGDITKIVSEEGYGRNEYVKTTRPLVVVTAPGPGSGKMATCLSQIYHEHKRGVTAGYAKFETFPIWNLPLKHPVNIAYEAATADLNDVNMIDPFHLEAYGETTVNYNRDIDIFPVLNAMFEMILGQSPYKSPTDMGVNMAGNCIIDDEVCCEAAKQEIICRYFKGICDTKLGNATKDMEMKLKLLMKQAGVTPDDRKVVVAAHKRLEQTGTPCAAIELSDGRIMTGRTNDHMGAAASCLLNSMKLNAGIDHAVHLISKEAIEPIQGLKTEYLGSKNPRLHTDEMLIALSVSAATNPDAALALSQLPYLKGCEAHSTVILSEVDERIFRKLGLRLTCDPSFGN